jgi:FAD/FMN-containing dehydrogenase
VIRRNGAQEWKNVHVTKTARLDDLIDIDNSAAGGPQPTGFALIKQAARELDTLIHEATRAGKGLRALGAGWALTDIAVTDGWLINTKLLNGCFDVSERYFDADYPAEKRPYLVLAQCGISIGELNVHLEFTATAGFRRALKTSGIGAGQTIAGAVSGNTHGSAINFGATPDFVVGLQLVTGNGKSLWIERASCPVLNDEFVAKLDAVRIRDDDVFNAALVSFGAFGIIASVAIETDPIYQLSFAPVNDIAHEALKHKLNNFDYGEPNALYHYEFVFDPTAGNRRLWKQWPQR